MSPSQKEGWDFAVAHAPYSLLKLIDQGVLSVWVVAEDTFRTAAQRMAQTGLLVKAANTDHPVQSPYLRIVSKQSLIMLRAAAELGFSPSGRASITLRPDGGGNNSFSNNGRPPAA